MFKKFCALALTGLLIGCRSALISTNGEVYDSISEIEEEAFETPESFRVGVLLPLSGDAARYGNGLKKAAMMARRKQRQRFCCSRCMPLAAA